MDELKAVHVVLTPFEDYQLCKFELDSFKLVYGKDWMDEIVLYANNLMENKYLKQITG